MNRNLTVDVVRTLAIILMIIFHFIYDLKFLGFAEIDIPDGAGWRQFRWFIISLFFLCLGVSLSFAHAKALRIKKYVQRLVQITSGAMLISVITYFYIPQNWIFFGVLHFLALASIVALPFIRLPLISYVIGVSVVGLGIVQLIPHRWPWYLFFPTQLPKVC